MLIEVKRLYKKKDYTIGKMYINGEYFCDTLEDTDRGLAQGMPLSELKEMKEYGKTAIPTGEYELKVTFSNRFQKYLPQLMNVPAFSGVRIHSGNTHADTEGCILCGKNKAKGKVLDSRKTIAELMRIIEYRLEIQREVVRIRIESNDRV